MNTRILYAVVFFLFYIYLIFKIPRKNRVLQHFQAKHILIQDAIKHFTNIFNISLKINFRIQLTCIYYDAIFPVGQ